MEAVWNLEDKWKLSTKQALLLLFVASGILGLCVAMTTTFLRHIKSRKTTRPPPRKHQLIIDGGEDWPPPPEDLGCGWVAITKVLLSSLRWSRARKWQQGPGESTMVGSTIVGSSWREKPSPQLMEKEMVMVEFHDDDDNSEYSPVWQRPILMGEKCQLPTFSGLILYDENGQNLCDVACKESSCKITTATQEKKYSYRCKENPERFSVIEDSYFFRWLMCKN